MWSTNHVVQTESLDNVGGGCENFGRARIPYNFQMETTGRQIQSRGAHRQLSPVGQLPGPGSYDAGIQADEARIWIKNHHRRDMKSLTNGWLRKSKLWPLDCGADTLSPHIPP